MQTYGASPTKRNRRTKGQLQAIRDAILQTLEADHPMTVRQVFYRLVSQGVIDKTEAEYKATVCRLLTVMRRAGELPFGWIADNTRWMRKPRTFSSAEEALRRTAQAYRRSLWDDQDAYVEIWLEKDALAGVLSAVTSQWDIPLMVTRGYPSLSYLYEAADAINDLEKPTFLYYFGDHDPSGVDITRAVEDGIREFAPDADITFHRVAVTIDQIEEWDLPTRHTKKTDSRSKNFEGESVEVDAIEPQQLRDLVGECIEEHVDRRAFAVTKEMEKSEKALLLKLMGTLEQESDGDSEDSG